MLTSGTVNTIAYKYQSGKLGFKHGFLQACFYFIGEYLNIFLYNIRLLSTKRSNFHFHDLVHEARTDKLELKFSKLVFALPSLLDALSTSLQVTSIGLMPPSINQMLIGSTVIATCFISKCMLKKSIHRHHQLGIGLSIQGCCSVGIAGFQNSNNIYYYGTKNLILGISLLSCSIQCIATLGNVEELILRKYHIDCQRMVGLEGLFGLLWMFFIISITTYIPCPSALICNVIFCI